MLSPARFNIDLRGHTERMAEIHSKRKRRSAIEYMRSNRVVQFLMMGGM